MNLVNLLLFMTSVALYDSLDPFTIGLLIVIFQSKRPKLIFIFFIVPFYFSYFLIGLIFLLIGNNVLDFISTNSTSLSIIEIIIYGLISISFILAGLYKLFQKPRPVVDNNATKSKTNLKLLDYSNYGCIRFALLAIMLNTLYIPFAYPYLGVVIELLNIELEEFLYPLLLAFYSLIFIMPYIVMLLIYIFRKEQSDALFKKFKNKIDNPKLIGVGLIAIGILIIFI